MDPDMLMWIWLIAGVGLSVAELIVPGMVTIFLGISAMIVAAGYKLGLLESVLSGFTTWFATSLVSMFTIRELAKKFLPGDSRYKKVNEDVEAYGEVVEVVDDVASAHSEGRIKFRGTTWQATTTTQLIPKGEKATIAARDGLIWIIEPVEDSLLDDIKPLPET